MEIFGFYIKNSSVELLITLAIIYAIFHIIMEIKFSIDAKREAKGKDFNYFYEKYRSKNANHDRS